MTDVKKNIALIIPGGIGTGANNIGVPVLEQLIKLLSQDYSITVFSLFAVNPDYSASGFKLISIPTKNSISKSIQLLKIFRSHHRKNKFEVIHGFWTLPCGILAMVLGKLFRVRSIVSVLGGDAVSLPEIGYGELRRWLPRKLILLTLRKANEVIVLTNYLLDNLKQVGFTRAVKIIPWGIDTSRFLYTEKKIGSAIQFLHIANFSPVKDQSTLLKAFKVISTQRPSHLTVVGTGILKEQVSKMIIEFDLQHTVTLAEPVPYHLLPPYYHRSDILLHTSLSEGQSEVVTEAMSAGVIVCGTKVGLLYDLPDCCVSVDVKDFKALADQVLQLLDQPNRAMEIRKNAAAWALTHPIHWTVVEIKKLYINVV